jgi:aarF domain-containing kinase
MYGTYKYNTDEGTRRAVQAYSTFIPVILHYRFLQYQQHLFNNVTDDDWKLLDALYAIPTVATLGELQGMYCKYGQTAAGFTNTLGDAWIYELRKLEDQVPPRPLESVIQTIQQETNGRLYEIFESIDEMPLGSASIGQVHRAVLKETIISDHEQSSSSSSSSLSPRREVAIKVQYPEAQALFRDDMKTIRSICEVFAPEQIVMLNALEKQNAHELDYNEEAHNLQIVRSNMIHHGFQPREVIVPRPVPQLTTSRMLVMELLPGVKLMDGIHEYYHEWAVANGTTLWELQQEARQRIEQEGIPAKYDGLSAWQVGLYRKYLRLQDCIVNSGLALYNWTIGSWIFQRTVPYHHSTLPPNTPRIVDILMRVHGYQLFADGFFNADPHGGNFMLLPDGRIGLIDFGATKKLTKNERLSACLLYAALGRNDSKMLFDMCDEGGYKSKYGNRDVLMKLIKFGYDSWGKDVMEGKNIQTFIDELKREDPWEEVPDNLVMAQFMSIRLRSLALGMNHPVKCSTYWGPIAEQILIQEGHPYETWDHDKLVKYKPELSMQKMDWGYTS